MSLFKDEADEMLKEAWLKKLGTVDEEAEMVSLHPIFYEQLNKYYNRPSKFH